MKYEVRVIKNTSEKCAASGFATILLDGKFMLRNIYVFVTDRKTMLAMPARKDSKHKGVYHDKFHPITNETREEFTKAVKQAYETGETVTGEIGTDNLTVTVNKVNVPGTDIKGFATILFGDCFAVRQIRITDNTRGRFVAFPSDKKEVRGEKRYFETCHPVTKEFAQKLTDMILDEYQKANA